MKTRYFYTLIGLFIFFSLKSQVGIGTPMPSTSAILELNSTNKGLLLSTVTLTSTSSPSPFSSHIEGMWVYNSATAGTSPVNVIPGLYYNDGAKWVLMSITNNLPGIGDIKSSVLTTDHDGWFLLNGRNISTLPTISQANATALGFTTVIPNSSDRILKGKNGSEALAATGGTNSYSLTQTNLPNLTLTGTTSSNGNHTHTYINRGGYDFWNYNSGSLPGLSNLNGDTRTTVAAGDHSHTFTVPSGGSGTAITQFPKHMVVQYFIYLGK